MFERKDFIRKLHNFFSCKPYRDLENFYFDLDETKHEQIFFYPWGKSRKTYEISRQNKKEFLYASTVLQILCLLLFLILIYPINLNVEMTFFGVGILVWNLWYLATGILTLFFIKLKKLREVDGLHMQQDKLSQTVLQGVIFHSFLLIISILLFPSIVFLWVLLPVVLMINLGILVILKRLERD